MTSFTALATAAATMMMTGLAWSVVTDVFGTDLPASAPFRAALIKALDGLLRNGSAATLRSYGA